MQRHESQQESTEAETAARFIQNQREQIRQHNGIRRIQLTTIL